MKSISLVLTFVACLSLSSFATIWRVNNNGGVDAPFTTIQTAHDGALAGDTIYIEGSAVGYGSLTANKPLHYFGPGYFLGENDSTQANPASAMIDVVTFSSGAAGSSMRGMTVTSRIDINESNIIIKRNRIDYQGIRIQSSASNVMIIQNFITNDYGSTAYSPVHVATGSSNIFIQNNYLQQVYALSTAIDVAGTASAQITNNVIDGDVAIVNSNMTNNIMFNGDTVATASNAFFNNIGEIGQFPVGNGNQQGVSMASMWDLSQTSTDGAFILDAGSPAIGAGISGEDCGMFGGLDPYVLSGLPPIPSIFFFSAPSSGSAATGLPITIKVKSNN